MQLRDCGAKSRITHKVHRKDDSQEELYWVIPE
jgi:hypothetical protein